MLRENVRRRRGVQGGSSNSTWATARSGPSRARGFVCAALALNGCFPPDQWFDGAADRTTTVTVEGSTPQTTHDWLTMGVLVVEDLDGETLRLYDASGRSATSCLFTPSSSLANGLASLSGVPESNGCLFDTAAGAVTASLNSGSATRSGANGLSMTLFLRLTPTGPLGDYSGTMVLRFSGTLRPRN